MYHVGRLGSYITRGVYTVSGPFHPFGGAVDIIVVEQPDGSFKSSPWYVRFGKFQGVLKAREKEVSISVNGVDANFHMYLDQRGEAYFLRELAGEEGEFVSSSSSSSSSSDETGENSQKIRRPMKSKSCNYDVVKSTLDDQIDAANGEIMPRTRSRRSRIFGLVFGRRSMKEDSYKSADDVDGAGIARISSLERAEIAANLLDVKWSTNLAAIKPIKDNTSLSSASNASDGKGDKHKLTNDGKMQVDSSMQEAMGFCVENNILIEESGSCDVQMGNRSQSAFENQEFLIKETNVEISSLVTSEQIVETISEVSCSNTRIVDASEAIPGNKFDEELGADGIQSFICCRKTENSVMGLDKSKEESDETLILTTGGPRDVHFCAETLHVTTELPSQDAVIQQAEEIELETVQIEYYDNYPQQKNSSPPVCGQDEVNLQVPLTLSELYAEKVSVDPTHNLVEVAPKNISSISGFNNSVHPTENEMIFGGKVNADGLQPSWESVIDAEQLNGDCDMTKAASAPVSESSEEEQFPFSDIIDSKYRESQRVSDSLDDVDKKDHSSCSPKGTLKIKNPLNTNYEPYSSQDCFFQKNQSSDTDNLIDNSNLPSNPISIHANAGAEVGLFTGSLPNMWSQIDNFGTEDGPCPLSRSLDSNFMSLEWKTPSKEKECFINSTTGKENQLSPARSSKGNSHLSENIKSGVVNPAVGDPSKTVVTSGGSWGIWPFRRSRSRKTGQSTPIDTGSTTDVENVSESNVIFDNDKNMVKPKVSRKKIRANTPTSEELASLNLKEGSNVVTFTFSTAMLGRQKVDARIFLWKWNTRIVISDVDGTITKSDVLGQFMPLVGVDWSQTGVAHLFSAIKENGYQLLFLSARAISQAYITRQFLVNLKQDGKALPDGPVVISPDGLFPSLYREVIRRAPHEFKIACLEDIKALFPSDCNPFYAGFGNRDTDEFSYLKVGIPKGKIFTINPKGEVSVHGRHDTKSYSSLHALVHGMFPVMTSSEQEDFNSWNFWRLPTPLIDT